MNLHTRPWPLATLLFASSLAAQQQVVHQDVLLGAGYFDYFQDLAFTHDGGLFALGTSYAIGAPMRRPQLVRYDRHVEREWVATYTPGVPVQHLSSVFVSPTQDDGCVVLSVTGTLFDYEIAKFDGGGQLEWQLLAPDPSGQFASPADMLIDPSGRTWISGGRYTSGFQPPRGRVTCVASDGALVFDRLYSTPEFTYVSALELGPQGELFAVGSAGLNPDDMPTEGCVARLDAAGNILWRTVVLGPSTYFAKLDDAASDGNRIVVTGSSAPGLVSQAACTTAALDLSGNVLWSSVLTAAGVGYDPEQCAVASDGSIAVAGTASYSAGDPRVFVASFTAGGNLRWLDTIPQWLGAHVGDLAIDPDGAILVGYSLLSAAQPSGRFAVRKYTSTGAVAWTQLGSDVGGACNAVLADADGSVYAAGLSYNEVPGGSQDGLLIVVDDFGRSRYCSAKLNTAGCEPEMDFAGEPHLSGNQPFHLTCAKVVSQKLGVLFYGTHGAADAPFQGGTMCVQAPVRRTPIQSSGGNFGPPDCSGAYDLDFGAWMRSGVDPALTAGTDVAAQHWYRDPGASFGTGLSDAVTLTIAP